MLNRVMSILVGCSAGIAVIFLMDMLSHMMYPLPEGIKLPETHDEWVKLIEIVPAGALVIVFIGNFLSGIVAGVVTTMISKENKLRNALIAGGILTVLGALNAFGIPHPLWFRIGTLFVYFAGAYIGSLIVMKLKKNA